MELSIGHASRLEPAVEDFLNPLQVSFALLRRDGDVADFVGVNIRDPLHAG